MKLPLASIALVALTVGGLSACADPAYPGPTSASTVTVNVPTLPSARVVGSSGKFDLVQVDGFADLPDSFPCGAGKADTCYWMPKASKS